MTPTRSLQETFKTAFAKNFLDLVLPKDIEAELLGKSGSLEVRLAATHKDIKRAQKLRYRVFFEEMNAIPDLTSRLKRRDIDPFDAICDHLLVIDTAAPAKKKSGLPSLPHKPRVVGTYRLLRQDVAEQHSGFYSAQEFDLQPLLDRHAGLRFLELGRSCVDPAYRDKRTVELLWHGIWAYVRQYQIDALFGCASFAGTDPDTLAVPLSFLHHHAQAKPDWQVKAQPSRAAPFTPRPADQVEMKSALNEMPPLIKAYMRVGARFGSDVVIDHQFGTSDVLVVLPIRDIHPKYLGYFGTEGRRYAA